MSSSGSRHLSIDIETRSSADLPSVGVYKYVAAPDFQVLLFGYSWDGEPAQVADLTREELPLGLAAALADPDVTKHAFNANFERVCLSRMLGMPEGAYLDPSQWRCTMVQAAYWGVQGGLKQVAAFLNVDAQKDAAGTRLINKFSKATAKPVAFEGGDWERFVAYCARDVDCEMEVASKLPGPIPEREQALYVLDQRINDRGVGVDARLAASARAMAEADARESKRRLAALTGLANPNSPAQLLGWLQGRGCPIGGCGREVLEAEAAREGCDPLAREAIEMRLASAKSSVKKYAVAEEAAGSDGRLRGCFQFYGAATGRWAGRLMQLQNLPRGDIHGPALDVARDVVREDGDPGLVRLLFGDVQGTLKSLVRTALVPREGHVFAVSDFSAIEARVLAWLAGEEWVLEVFRGDGRVYEATASRMFGVPIDRVDKELRQRGKVATLALGYQGGPKALERMGALKMGIPEGELPRMVRMWRNANRRTKQLWGEAERAAYAALSGEGPQKFARGAARARLDPSIDGLAIDLASGRSLHYRRARVDPADGSLSYRAAGKGAGALKVETYGGRLVENVTQAIARDLLAEAMARLEEAGYEIVAHVHDEVIVEVPCDRADWCLGRVNALMGATAPEWATGLPLRAEGYTCESYRKE